MASTLRGMASKVCKVVQIISGPLRTLTLPHILVLYRPVFASLTHFDSAALVAENILQKHV